ncbi:hypothetical protein Tco_1013181 [Tanacetum coccineum]
MNSDGVTWKMMGVLGVRGATVTRDGGGDGFLVVAGKGFYKSDRDLGILTASQQTPITIQPSTSKPQKKQSRRKQKKTTAVPHPSDSTADVQNEESVPTHSNDLLLSSEYR